MSLTRIKPHYIILRRDPTRSRRKIQKHFAAADLSSVFDSRDVIVAVANAIAQRHGSVAPHGVFRSRPLP